MDNKKSKLSKLFLQSSLPIFYSLQISNVLILNLAAVDLCYATTVIFPTIGSVLAERWIYGAFLCAAANYAESFIAASATGLLIAFNIRWVAVNRKLAH